MPFPGDEVPRAHFYMRKEIINPVISMHIFKRHSRAQVSTAPMSKLSASELEALRPKIGLVKGIVRDLGPSMGAEFTSFELDHAGSRTPTFASMPGLPGTLVINAPFLNSVPQEHLRAILAHELAHERRGDAENSERLAQKFKGKVKNLSNTALLLAIASNLAFATYNLLEMNGRSIGSQLEAAPGFLLKESIAVGLSYVAVASFTRAIKAAYRIAFARYLRGTESAADLEEAKVIGVGPMEELYLFLGAAEAKRSISPISIARGIYAHHPSHSASIKQLRRAATELDLS